MPHCVVCDTSVGSACTAPHGTGAAASPGHAMPGPSAAHFAHACHVSHTFLAVAVRTSERGSVMR
jgi:hypothetical protein